MKDMEQHTGMNHTHSEEIPEGMQAAQKPKYPIGSKVTVTTGHMPGMKGAKATVAGAYDTIVYTVTYKPTTGGELVKNHKWVVQEEMKEVDSEPFQPGSEIVLMADHMKGMKGATANIDSSEKTTVYVIDYVPTTGGELVKNHKWMTEDELSAES